MSYARAVEAICEHLGHLTHDHPLRVSVDGRTACGKSTFAKALCVSLERRGRRVLHTTIDGFHNPRAVRYARGRYSAEGYFQDARDLCAVRRELLDPLGPGGDGMIRTGTWDLDADVPSLRPQVHVPPETIVIVDGTFLARPELFSGWDQRIFLVTSKGVARQRGIRREMASGSDKSLAEALFDQRYLPAFELYLAEADPQAHADVLVDLEDVESPILRRTYIA